jgi:hypothetical protein
MKLSRRRLFTLLAAAAAAGTGGLGARAATSRYYDGPISDHFDGLRFLDPDGMPPKSIRDVVRWWSSGRKSEWPLSYPSPHSDRPPPRVAGSSLRVAFVGHASLLVQAGGLNVLVDPVWSDRVSPVSFAGPKRVNDPGIPFEALPAIDAVLVSHCHYDHLDLATLSRLAAAHRPRVITPLGNDFIMRRHDPAIRAEGYDWGDRVDLGALAVTLMPMRHWSAGISSTATRHCGRRSASTRRPDASITSGIPVMAMAGASARRAGRARSGSPSCRSEPMSRAGSCASST